MRFPSPYLRPEQRLTGVAITLMLHLALLYGWFLTRQLPRHADNDDPSRIQWIKIAPPPPARPLKPLVPTAAAHPRPAPAPRGAAPAAAPVPAPVEQTAAIAAPAAPSAGQMLEQAKRDLGKIDRELRKEFPGAAIKAPADSPQLRLAKGIEHAAEMAPPKWYEGPKVTELIDPGGYGRKRYRVITANGTYCVTYESNHAPDGLDTMKNGIKPKLTNCPPDEQAATSQKWEQ